MIKTGVWTFKLNQTFRVGGGGEVGEGEGEEGGEGGLPKSLNSSWLTWTTVMFFSTYEIQQTQSSQDRKAEGDTISSGVGLPQAKWTSGWLLFVGYLTSQQHVMMQSTSGTSVGDLTSQQHAVYLWDLCWRSDVPATCNDAVYLWDLCWLSDVPATCSLPLGPLLAIWRPSNM